MTTTSPTISPIIWRRSELHLLDQRLLPHDEQYVICRDAHAVAEAISAMVVRGAPAIGVAAAYGIAMAVGVHIAGDKHHWQQQVRRDAESLRQSRPTAVNLMWAIDRMLAVIEDADDDAYTRAVRMAEQIHEDDVAANRRLGDFGAEVVAEGHSILTHCNAGALATAGYGTALGVIRSAFRSGKIDKVYATETRPWLQGARLTAWELLRDGIDVTLIADSAAAHLLKTGAVDWVVTGADRIAANGDTANKIGTYGLACLAREHGVSFMVAAPLSTIDRSTADGESIPLEERGADELTHLSGQAVASSGVRVFNPVFDVTPARLIDVIATEKGIVQPPSRAAIEALFRSPK